jgi:hypothetical protein
MIKSLCSIAAGLALTAAATPAWSYCTTFSGTLNTCFGLTADAQGLVTGNAAAAKAEFLTNVTNVGTLDFSQYPLAVADPYSVATPSGQALFKSGATTVNWADFSESIYTGPYVVQDSFDPDNSGQTLRSLGRFNTSPLAGDPNGMILESAVSFTITFNQAVQAFGFYGTDIGDFGGSLTLELYETDDATTPSVTLSVFEASPSSPSSEETDPPGEPLGGSLLFFGFFDSAKSYKKIGFFATSDDDAFGYDDMMVASLTNVPPPNPTPEPAGLALAGLALAAAGLARRRSARRTN